MSTEVTPSLLAVHKLRSLFRRLGRDIRQGRFEVRQFASHHKRRRILRDAQITLDDEVSSTLILGSDLLRAAVVVSLRRVLRVLHTNPVASMRATIFCAELCRNYAVLLGTGLHKCLI